MNVLLSILKIAGAVLSTYGYFRLLRRKTGIPAEFCPVIVLSTIGVLVFISGILNLMIVCFWLVFLTGFALLVSDFRRTVKEYGQGVANCYVKDLTPGIIVFIILGGYLFIWLSQCKYYYYDNFSFWGLAVKLLCFENEFPKFDNAILEFTSYPLGSASLIWYFCKIIGYTEGHTLFVQSAYILSCVLPLFAFTDKKSRSCYALTAVIAFIGTLCFVTCGKDEGNGIYNLAVDVVLAAVAFAAYSVLVYYQNNIKLAAALTVPLLSFEISVKNSGAFWVIMISALILFCCLRSKENRRNVAVLTGSNLLIPLCIRIIWDAHVRYVFANYKTGNHAVALGYYHRMISEKSIPDIIKIGKSFLHSLFSTDNNFWFLLTVFILFAILVYLIDRDVYRRRKLLLTGVFIVALYLCYQAGTFFVYLFSMSLDEAEELASFSRYSMTADIFIWGVIIVSILKVFSEFSTFAPDRGKKRSSLSRILTMVLCAALLIFESGSISSLVRRRENSELEKTRDRLEEIQTEYGLYDGTEKYLVYISQRDGEFRKFMSKYVLYAPDLKTVTKEQLADMTSDEMSQYDRFIILEQDEAIGEWMEEHEIGDTRCIDLSAVNVK